MTRPLQDLGREQQPRGACRLWLSSDEGTRASYRRAGSGDFAVARALNSSKITFVHAAAGIDQAVAMMVRLPPSSILRAAPKKRLGRCSALESTPPESNLAAGGHDVVVGARQAGDGVEQDHHVLLQLHEALGAPRSPSRPRTGARQACSKVEAMISSPLTERCILGRSRALVHEQHHRCTSGWLAVMAWAMVPLSRIIECLASPLRGARRGGTTGSSRLAAADGGR